MRPIRVTALALISLVLVCGFGNVAPAGDNRTEPAAATTPAAIELREGLPLSLGARDRRADLDGSCHRPRGRRPVDDAPCG